MKEKIKQELSQLEREYDVTIISARDFGSTAWNLDSEDSDRDVAFIFKQPKSAYYKLDTYQQNIDRDIKIDGQEHTFMGWNLKRFMSLLDGSNPTTIEYLNSPITYFEAEPKGYMHGEWIPNPSEEQLSDPEFATVRGEIPDGAMDKLKREANDNFKPIALFYHYRSMAKNNFEKYIENSNDITVKRHLYIIRGLAYARYVEETHEMPPLDFPEFHKNQMQNLDSIPEFVKQYTQEFIRKKKNGEADTQIADKELWDWMRKELDNKLDKEKHDIRGIDTELINNTMEEII